MYQVFLAIISLIAAGYSFFTKQPKMGLGFLIIAGSAFLLNPNLAIGVRADFYGATALVLFVLGSLVIVWKKREPKVEESESKEKEEEKKSIRS